MIKNVDSIDAVVLAGEREGSIPVMGKNKALLDFRGRPLIDCVVESLDKAERVKTITVVGPPPSLEDALSKIKTEKTVKLVEQGSNVFENIWRGSMSTFPDGNPDSTWDDMADSPHKEKFVLALTCDVPMLHPVEVNRFVETMPADRADFIFGVSTEEILKPYEPTDTEPGITFLKAVLKEKIIRHSNVICLRPLRLGHVMEKYIPMAYGLRYQRHYRNIIKGLFKVLRHALDPGSLSLFLLVQSASWCHNHGHYGMRDVIRRPVTLEWAERQASEAIGTRFAIHETAGPGPTLDVDDEESYRTFLTMIDKWREIQAEQLRPFLP